MIEIIKAFIEDRMPIAEIRKDGLLYSGNKNSQYTWMDAAVNGKPVIPRHGAAVEMNALWYNAVSFLYLEFGDFLELGLLEKIEYKMQLFENHYIRDIQSGSAVYCQGVYGAGMEYG